MANVRVVSFASDGIPSQTHPFTLFHRLNTSKSWTSHGLSASTHLASTLASTFDRVCSLPTRVILRTDDGSGLEVSIREIVGIVEEESMLGKGKLKSLYLVVYERDPIPRDSLDGAENVGGEGEQKSAVKKEKSGCCALQ